jgi:hypothetical protein
VRDLHPPGWADFCWWPKEIAPEGEDMARYSKYGYDRVEANSRKSYQYTFLNELDITPLIESERKTS